MYVLSSFCNTTLNAKTSYMTVVALYTFNAKVYTKISRLGKTTFLKL